MHSYDYAEVSENVDENIIGGVEDMFYDFDSEIALAIWNKYVETELTSFQKDGCDDKVYYNDPSFFIDIEMKRNGLEADEILERVRLSGASYNPKHRYIRHIAHIQPKPYEFSYMTSDRATNLMDADPDFANYLIDLYKQEE